MKKYNSQKHTTGRSNNRANKKDSFTETNNVYLIFEAPEFSIYIDSIFSSEWYCSDDKSFKSLYVSRNNGEKIQFALIDEDLAIDCDFMDNVKKVYELSLSNPVITDRDEKNKILFTTIVPNAHHAYSSDKIPLADFKGFYFENGFYDLYLRGDKNWTISGHSSSFYEKESEMIDIDRIKKMNSFEFYEYFHSLVDD